MVCNTQIVCDHLAIIFVYYYHKCVFFIIIITVYILYFPNSSDRLTFMYMLFNHVKLEF